jgi:hypothetical protein
MKTKNIKVVFEVIPHSKQRYPTVGDWFYDEQNVLHVVSSELPDARFEQLIHHHEYTEAILCDAAGVDQAEVDAFDIAFERHRTEGNLDEPGDCAKAPYYKQHQIATAFERVLAAELNVDWNDYEKAINEL